MNMNVRGSPCIKTTRKLCAALTLTELMCVIAIVAILAAFYLPVVFRAFTKVKNFLSEF